MTPLKCRWILTLFLLVSSAAWSVQKAAVVVQSVRELAVGAPIVVNGEIRARYDIVLPSTVDGRLDRVVEEGTVIHKGDVLAKVDDTQLRLQRREQKLLADRARINLEYLQGQVDRQTRLASSNLIAQTQLADTVSRRDMAASDLAVAQAKVAELDDTLSRTEIKSPINGIVIARLHRGGEYARVGEGVLHVIDPGSLEVVVDLPLSQFNSTRTARPVSVSVAGFSFESKVRAIIDAGDRSSQTFEALVDVPARYAHEMAAGQFAEVTVSPATGRKELFVPRDAVVLRTQGSYVYRIGRDNMAQRIAVKLGVGHGGMIAVTGDLSPGDRVAVRGMEGLTDGQHVVPVPG